MIERQIQAAVAKRRSRFQHAYDASQLVTIEACTQDLNELQREIAEIEGQLADCHALPADALTQEDRVWFRRAKAALALKHRLRHAINARKGQLVHEARRALNEEHILRERQLQIERLEQLRLHEAEVRQRRERDHQAKMERIAAASAKMITEHQLFVRLARERFGDEAADAIWTEVHVRLARERAA